MARGRKKSVTMLEGYKTELTRLILLEKDMLKNLEVVRTKIQETKDKIKIEEFNQIKLIMEQNNMDFDDVKRILTGNLDTKEVEDETVENETVEDDNNQNVIED